MYSNYILESHIKEAGKVLLKEDEGKNILKFIAVTDGT